MHDRLPRQDHTVRQTSARVFRRVVCPTRPLTSRTVSKTQVQSGRSGYEQMVLAEGRIPAADLTGGRRVPGSRGASGIRRVPGGRGIRSVRGVRALAVIALAVACASCGSGSGVPDGSTGTPGESGPGTASDATAMTPPEALADAADPGATPRSSGNVLPTDPSNAPPADGRPADSRPTNGPPAAAPARGAVIRVDPWRDGTDSRASDAPEPATDSDFCRGSVTSPRSDAYRCFHGSAIRDPCFADPADGSQYMCVPDEGTSWIRLRGVAGSDPNPGGHPDRVFWVQLGNGAECKASSGAGPTALPGYQSWAGSCTGGPWTMQRLTWRIADETPQGTEFPLLPAPENNQLLAAVETAEGHVERFPVATAYR